MPKLHELIAVEKDIKKTAEKIIKETAKTFKDKGDHFKAMERRYEPINDEDTEVLDGEVKEMSTTVNSKLQYFNKHMVKLFDCLYQKELSNTVANSDLVIKTEEKNIEIGKGIPVTFLVQIEKVLETLRGNVYNSIPTLTPSIRWELDDNLNNIYVSPEVRKLRTKKLPKIVSLAKATKEHPEQTTMINEDKPTGYWIQKEWSGELSVAEKSFMLSRIDELIIAVKKARARANNTDIFKGNIGYKIFNYITNAE